MGQPGEHGGDAVADSDLPGNVVEMNDEWTELSTAPLPDEIFTVPANFRSVSMKDIMHAAPAIVPTTPLPAGLKPPVLISRRDPELTKEAREAKIEGTVVLRVVIGADGVPRDARVLKPLSPDLDRKAIEAVSQGRFSPGEKDGKPVEVISNIEINFRLGQR
jgi:TonB family protein